MRSYNTVIENNELSKTYSRPLDDNMVSSRVAAHLVLSGILLLCFLNINCWAATGNDGGDGDNELNQFFDDKPDTVPKYDKPLLQLIKQQKSVRFPFLSLKKVKDSSDSSKQKTSPGVTTPKKDTLVEETEGRKVGLYGVVQSREKCQNDTDLFMAALALNVPWAVQMYDAYGKMTTGLLITNIKWPGAYEECLDVRATSLDPNVTEVQFSGQYCTGTLIVDSELDTNAIAAIAVFGFVGFLMALGTALDIMLVQMPKWRLARMSSVTKVGIDSVSGVSSGEAQPLIDSKKPAHATEPGTVAKLLISFSVYTNGSKLLSTYQPPGSLTCVHGIRFLSMTWRSARAYLSLKELDKNNGQLKLAHVLLPTASGV
nr:hypothetical protein BaRGS_005752 [Batillaria attramentaria]